MSRPLRIQYEGAVYHVINRGTAERPESLHPQHRFIVKRQWR